MKRKAVIHIGTEKTGTTTIQHYLRANKDALAGQGIYLPDTLGKISHTTLCVLAELGDWALPNKGKVPIGMDPAVKAAKKRAFEEEMQALPADAHTVTFSNEHLHRRLVSEREVANLKAILDPYFDEFRIIVYLRRQDKLAASLYSTGIKYGTSWRLPIFPGPNAANAHYYNYRMILEKYDTLFGRENVTARIFEPKRLLGGDLLRDFDEAAGIDGSKMETPNTKNRSLSPAALVVLSTLNERAPEKGDALIQEHCVGMLEEKFNSSKQIAPRPDAQEFYAMFAESNRWVRDTHFPDLPETLFDPDFSAYPDVKTRIQPSVEDVLKVFAELWDTQRGQRKRQRERIKTMQNRLQKAGLAAEKAD